MDNDPIVIDCDSCEMQHTGACADCVVSVLLTNGTPRLDDDERRALDALADVGLVPRLRLVPPGGTRDARAAG